MSDINEQLENVSSKLTVLKNNKLTKFAYTQTAYDADDAEGVGSYDYEKDNNIPVASATDTNDNVLSKGLRAQSSSVPRMLLNHIFGRTSYNLNKAVDYLKVVVDSVVELTKKNGRYQASTKYAQYDECTVYTIENDVLRRRLFVRTSNTPALLSGIPPCTVNNYGVLEVNTTHWKKIDGDDITVFITDTYAGNIYEVPAHADVFCIQHTVEPRVAETVTIPSSFALFRKVTIRRIAPTATNEIIITPPAGATIEWKSGYWLYEQYSSVTLERVSETQFVITSRSQKDMIATYAHGVWTISKSAADNPWTSVCYGNGLFVAVASNGVGNRVMTSPDGITWTLRASAADNKWTSVCYGNGLFVAVATTGVGNRVMTSPDGITWTLRSSAVDSVWYSVCYGNGLFVAVAHTGVSIGIMTSPDGITWTSRGGASYFGNSVCYGNGLFVSVISDVYGNGIRTSPDGITWTTRSSGVTKNWNSVCYGNGLFVAVASNGAGYGVMTSPDGITWTGRASASDAYWNSVCYGNGLFVAVADTGVGNRVMTSTNGITWTIPLYPADNPWTSVCYGNGLFVAVADDGVGNRVMKALAPPA